MVGNRNPFARIAALVFSVYLVTSLSADQASAEKVHESIQGQFVVHLTKPGKNIGALEQKLQARVVDVIREDLVLVERETKEPRTRALSNLRSKPEVLSAEPNYIFRALKTPNDADFAKLWGMRNSGGLDTSGLRGLAGVDISAEKAWDKTTGSKDVIVAIIDTGIDFKVADLAPNAWTNEKELNGKKGVDDDGNGYIDDIHGYDFVNNDGDSTDDNGHGTHCAGTIGARGDDGVGVAGVAWNVSLMGIKFLDQNGSGSLANAIKAIDYARINGAHILSNSWGGGPFIQALFDSIELTKNANQLFVAAAGNDGNDNDVSPTYPSAYNVDNVLAVAAVDSRGELADFSNFGKTNVDIAAPGVEIFSTLPGGFGAYSGTSMATPHVSGVAALLLADNKNLTYLQLKERLMTSARPLKSLEGLVATGGLLDANLALTGDPVPQDPNDASRWVETLAQNHSTPHPYPDEYEQTFKITVPGAKRIAAHFLKFEFEAGYDTVQFFNAQGDRLGTWSGTKDGRFSPIAEGDTLTLKVTADASVDAHGFDIDFVSFEK